MRFRHRFLLLLALIGVAFVGFVCWASRDLPEPPPPAVGGPHP